MSLLEFNCLFRLLLSLSQFQPIFMSFVAILSHVTVSRRPCWWSRTKAFLSSSGTDMCRFVAGLFTFC